MKTRRPETSSPKTSRPDTSNSGIARRLIDPTYKTDLVSALDGMAEVTEVSLIMQRSTVEI